MLDSFTALIDRFGIAEFGEAIDTTYGAAKQMRRRNSVPAKYWPLVLAAAEARGWADVTADELTRLARITGERRERTAACKGRAPPRLRARQ